MLALVDESVRDLTMNHVTGEPRKTIAVVMELHPSTLAQHYKKHGRTLTPAQKLRMCCDLLSALYYVWEHRLVHFDIKFDNVLVAEDGRLVLSDFGTAQEVDKDGCFLAMGPLIGNQEHMAPEVLLR
jgi:serine/threonine protein kinase